MADPLTIAIVTGLISGVGSSLVTSLITSRLQHHFWQKRHRAERVFWKVQRADEIRLEAVKAFNRLTNEYVAACVSQTATPPPIDEWLRDLNIAASTIKNFFSDEAYRAAKKAMDGIQPYNNWKGLLPLGRKKLADDFTDASNAALRALYGEVVDLKPAERNPLL
jgi:hypothetical protein